MITINGMWTRSHSIVTKEATKEQMWKLFSDVNSWHKWDSGIEYAEMEGKFEKGTFFVLKPKGVPKLKSEISEAIENETFTNLTRFPLAKMYFNHTFEDTSEGLRVTETITVTGILGFLWGKIVAEGIVEGLPDEMAAQVKFAGAL